MLEAFEDFRPGSTDLLGALVFAAPVNCSLVFWLRRCASVDFVVFALLLEVLRDELLESSRELL